MRLIALTLLLLSATAQAEVYKCVVDGKATYTDRPCDAAGQPAKLPALNTIEERPGPDLAKRYDERLKHEGQSRDKADAAYLKSQAAKASHEQALRSAIIEHRVIKGMRPEEVVSALGAADDQLPDGSWRYHQDGRRLNVRFKDGQVSAVSTTNEKKIRR